MMEAKNGAKNDRPSVLDVVALLTGLPGQQLDIPKRRITVFKTSLVCYADNASVAHADDARQPQMSPPAN
jgi:hypothetical protein